MKFENLAVELSVKSKIRNLLKAYTIHKMIALSDEQQNAVVDNLYSTLINEIPDSVTTAQKLFR